MALPISLCFLMLPFSSGTPPFLMMFSLSDTASEMVMMCVPGTIMSVMVHGARCFTWLPGCVGLIDQSCCSQKDISREGMDSGCLNCAGKDVSFMSLQTAFMGDMCFCIVTWICVHSCLICYKENTKATQPTKAYDTKPANTALEGILHR